MLLIASVVLSALFVCQVTKETLALLSKGKHVFPSVRRSRGDSTPIDVSSATLDDLLWLFVERERLQLTSLGDAMAQKLGQGKKLFDVWSVAAAITHACEIHVGGLWLTGMRMCLCNFGCVLVGCSNQATKSRPVH